MGFAELLASCKVAGTGKWFKMRGLCCGEHCCEAILLNGSGFIELACGALGADARRLPISSEGSDCFASGIHDCTLTGLLDSLAVFAALFGGISVSE